MQEAILNISQTSLLNMSRKRLAWLLGIFTLEVMLLGCRPSLVEVEFDLVQPPTGWYRHESPSQQGYSIWLPGNWEVKGGQQGHHITSEYYQSNDGSDNSMGVNWISAVDFKSDPREPVAWQQGGIERTPDSIYSVEVADILIPCARYLGPMDNQVSHACVIGPHSSGRYHELHLSTNDDDEGRFMSDWYKMVASFVLEQPLDSTQPLPARH